MVLILTTFWSQVVDQKPKENRHVSRQKKEDQDEQMNNLCTPRKIYEQPVVLGVFYRQPVAIVMKRIKAY